MKIVHTNDVAWAQQMDKGRFSQKRKELGGAGKITAGLWSLAPGKRSFPMHSHAVTDEAMYVVSGHAKVRTPDGESPIGPGDWVSFPAGDGVAHQLVNDGAEDLVYLALGANPIGVDVVEYPDSGKVASMIMRPEGRKRFVFRGKDQVDYFDGEE